MVLATLILTLWGQSVTMFVAITVNSLANNTSVGTRLFCDNCFRLIFNWLPILVCALLLAKGRLGCNYPRFLHFFRSRFRLCTAAILWVLINCGMNVCGRWQSLNPLISGSANSRITYIVWANFWSSLLYMTIWPFLLVTLLVWLMPAQYHKFSKLA